MNIQFEVHTLQSKNIDEIKKFWDIEWNKNFNKLIGKDLDESLFEKNDYFYILRFDGKIGAIMTSAWQKTNSNISDDHYYSSWPEASVFLHDNKIINFQKMGMIAAKIELIPRHFKLTQIIIGCGLKYVVNNCSCDGVVSFPRSDTSVFKACLDWGAISIKSGLKMYNVPVSFIFVPTRRTNLFNKNNIIDKITSNLYASRYEEISHPLVA